MVKLTATMVYNTVSNTVEVIDTNMHHWKINNVSSKIPN